MAKFEVEFVRTYTITEGFSRVIEAPDRAAALEKAADLLPEFNQDCPDDCTESGEGEAGAFDVGDVIRVRDDTVADYPIEGEG